MLTVFAVPAHPNVLPDGAEATGLVCAACSFCGVCSITLSSRLQSDRNPTPPAEAEQSRCQLPAAAPADHRTLSSLNQHKCILLLSGSQISFPAFRCRRTCSFWRLSGALVCPLPVRLLVFPGLWPLPPPSIRITDRGYPYPLCRQIALCLLFPGPLSLHWGPPGESRKISPSQDP